jgi:hypothetical protein
MVTLGRVVFIWVKFRPFEFVKAYVTFVGESSRAYTRGEAWLMVARAASARALTWRPMM